MQALVQERDLLKIEEGIRCGTGQVGGAPRFPRGAVTRHLMKRYAPRGVSNAATERDALRDGHAPRRRRGGCGQSLRGPARGPSIEA